MGRVCYKPRDFRPGSARFPQFPGFFQHTIPAMPQAFVPIVLFLAVAIGFAFVTLLPSRLLQTNRYNKVKLDPYECGIEPKTDARDRYSIRYYLVAMLFVIFDVETVFMFPWAVVLERLGVFGLIEMLVFLFILVVGFVYAWKKGALEWT
jgi:NADH-quinone oxidoreductase subunit A